AVPDSQTPPLDRSQLTRFVWAGAMTIGALVLPPERGFERRHCAVVDRAVWYRHYQLVGLAPVMQRRRTLNACTRSDKPFGRELDLRFARERVPGSADVGEVGAAQRAAQRARVMMLKIRVEQSERREQPCCRRHHHATDAERQCHSRRE